MPTETTTTFDNQQITLGVTNDHANQETRYWLSIRSPQARTRSRLAGTFHTFKTAEDRQRFLDRWLEQRREIIQAREAKKALKAQLTASFVNPYKVGDILHSHWGYDQTNIEFFEVLAVGPRSLKIVELHATVKETGFMCGDTEPRPGQHHGEPKWVTIQISVYNGKLSHSVPSPIHGHLHPHTPGQKHRSSWYA